MKYRILITILLLVSKQIRKVGKARNKTILEKGLKQKENLLLYSNQSKEQRQKNSIVSTVTQV